MTIPIGWPIQTKATFEIINTSGNGGPIRRRQRFPWSGPFREWRIQFGPATYAELESDVLTTIRNAKGGAALSTGYIPGVGFVQGFFGDDIEWTNASPTAHYITVTFREEAASAV